MIAAPAPPAKIAPVIAKKRMIASVCLNRRLKKYAKIGARARESVIDRYPWTTVFKGLFDLYDGCLRR